MPWKKSSLYPIPISIALLIVGANPASYLVRAELPSRPRANASEIQTDWNEFPPPEDGLPGRRVGGGTRGGPMYVCPPEVQNLTALIPEKTHGRTVWEHPTFLVYVPPLSEAKRMQFTILEFASDGSYEEVYIQKFRTAWTGGVMRVSLPNYGPSLEVGKHYYWDFSISCNPEDPSGDVLVSGWIERIRQSVTLQENIASAQQSDRPALYVREGLWYDAAASLASLRMSEPDNLSVVARWRGLLDSVKLSDIAGKRLVQSNSAPYSNPVANQLD